MRPSVLVTGIVAFYKSTAGQAFVQKLPVLTSKSVEIGGRIMSGSEQQIQTMTAPHGPQA